MRVFTVCIDGREFQFRLWESLAGDSRFRDMFSQDFYRRNAVAIVCDEVYTVVDW